MSVKPGAVLSKDPDASLVYQFDWDDWLGAAAITSSTFTVAGPDAVLTKDQEAIEAGARATHARLSGGTVGRDYTLANRIVTNESPSQTDERSITIRIKQQ